MGTVEPQVRAAKDGQKVVIRTAVVGDAAAIDAITREALAEGTTHITEPDEFAVTLEDARRLVRGARYSGRSRVLRRLALGVVKSLEVEDASPTCAALLALRRWVERVAEAESERAAARCAYHEERWGRVPGWVQRGMGARWGRVEQLEHRVQMLLGIFAAKGVLPLEFKPAHSVGDLLVQHLDELEHEAEGRGGVQRLLLDHFARVYKCCLLLPLAA